MIPCLQVRLWIADPLSKQLCMHQRIVLMQNSSTFSARIYVNSSNLLQAWRKTEAMTGTDQAGLVLAVSICSEHPNQTV